MLLAEQNVTQGIFASIKIGMYLREKLMWIGVELGDWEQFYIHHMCNREVMVAKRFWNIISFLILCVCVHMCVCVCVCVCVCACSVMSDSLQSLDCSLPGSSVHGIFQARILEWGAISSSGDLTDPGIEHLSSESPALVVGLSTTELPGSPS